MLKSTSETKPPTKTLSEIIVDPAYFRNIDINTIILKKDTSEGGLNYIFEFKNRDTQKMVPLKFYGPPFEDRTLHIDPQLDAKNPKMTPEIRQERLEYQKWKAQLDSKLQDLLAQEFPNGHIPKQCVS